MCDFRVGTLLVLEHAQCNLVHIESGTAALKKQFI